MSNRLEKLSSEVLLDMELEDLAVLFLLDFSDIPEPRSILSFIRNNARGNDNNEYKETSQALLETFQFLCNEGLLAYNELKGSHINDYFITRKGHQALEDYREEEYLEA